MCFPGLVEEWTGLNGQRPFVGTLTMESPTDADDEVASWIAAGTPPIFLGFGSMPVDLPPRCSLLSARSAHSWVSARWWVPGGATSPCAHFDHVKVVGS